MRLTTIVLIAFLMLAFFPLGSLLRPPLAESQPSPRIGAADLGTRIDLNTSDVPTLSLLPGVGPPMAERIVEHRTRTPFQNTGELRLVNGVGDSILSRSGPYVVVNH